MKKSFLSCAVLSAALASGAVQADQHFSVDSLVESGYAQLHLGTADLGLDDNATVLTGVVGSNLDNVREGLAVEADLTMTLMDAESEFFGTSFEASYTKLGGYAVYNYPLVDVTEGLSIFGRGGLAYTSLDIESASDSSIDLAFGLGAKYEIRDQIKLTGQYDTYESIDVFSIGAEYSF